MTKQQLSITTLQINLVWQDKLANMNAIEQKINALNIQTNVVVLPEMFTTGFSMDVKNLAETMDGPSVNWMKKIAIQNKIILTGSLMIEENGLYYNRMIWMQPNGVFYCYDKRHCFSLAKENEHFTAGKKKIIVQANGIKICLQICYDLRFPVYSRQSKNELYDVLLYVANWPSKRAYAWKQLLIARAIENQCYVIGVNRVGTDANLLNYNGGTCVINPMGEIKQEHADTEKSNTYLIEKKNIELIRTTIPFLQDGDDFRIL